MSSLETLHTVLLGLVSVLFTVALPWLVSVERRLSRIEQQILSDLKTVSQCLEHLKSRVHTLEIEHAQYHPHCGQVRGEVVPPISTRPRGE